MKSAITELPQIAVDWRRQWSWLEMAERNNSAEWPARHDYPQFQEGMLNLKT